MTEMSQLPDRNTTTQPSVQTSLIGPSGLPTALTEVFIAATTNSSAIMDSISKPESPPSSTLKLNDVGMVQNVLRNFRVNFMAEHQETLVGVKDFIIRLYSMLDEKSLEKVVAWRADGLAFRILDVNAFTSIVLPKYYRHNKFASFTRQLNKYKFRKVKRGDVDFTESSGSFKKSPTYAHPFFIRDRLDLLINIQREVESEQRAKVGRVMADNETESPRLDDEMETGDLDEQKELAPLTAQQISRHSNKRANTDDDDDNENNEADDNDERDSDGQESLAFKFGKLRSVHKQMAKAMRKLTTNFQVATKEILSLRQQLLKQDKLVETLVQEVAKRDALLSNTMIASSAAVFPNINMINTKEEQSSASGNNDLRYPIGCQPMAVFMPKRTKISEIVEERQQVGQDKRRTESRGKRIAPVWKVAPRVLLVEDDPTCRKLSGRLLQILGCKYDVATDGLAAVTRMNLDKYDIVLMDIMLPNLDGVSATHHIRQFDKRTPIISMTSNTTETDCRTYFSTGMTDILAKPFSRDNFFDILERYCSHLTNHCVASTPTLITPTYTTTSAASAANQQNINSNTHNNNVTLASATASKPPSSPSAYLTFSASPSGTRTVSPSIDGLSTNCAGQILFESSDPSRYFATIATPQEWLSAMSEIGLGFGLDESAGSQIQPINSNTSGNNINRGDGDDDREYVDDDDDDDDDDHDHDDDDDDGLIDVKFGDNDRRGGLRHIIADENGDIDLPPVTLV